MKTKKKKVVREKLPPNPKVNSGITLIYTGSRKLVVKGKYSGEKYYVSSNRRFFKIHTDDLDSILKHKYFMIKP